ncbi:hypothetical protein [Lagierella sp.]|uniref:hypothetical protein n=1 Tax=Lagierella sp. TaxID=2849657 RepID=UPI00261B7E4A|nr:hypothetical protein [Lagierella sp.]
MKFTDVFKNRNFLIGLGVLFLIIIGIVIFNLNSYEKNFSNLPIEGDYSNIVINSKGTYLLKDRYLVRYSGDGKETLRINLPSQGGNILGDERTIVYYSNNNIYFLDKSGKIKYSEELKFPIETCILSGDKVLAMGKSNYSILDIKGRVLKSNGVKGRILVGDLANDRAIITSIIKKKEDDNQVNSFIDIVDIETLGEKKLTFPREIIFYNKVLRDDKILTISNREARVMEDENIVGKKKIKDFKSAGIRKDNVYILEDDKFGVYDSTLKNLKKMELKGDFSSLAVSNDRVLLYNSKGFAQYKGGEIRDYIQTEEIYNSIVRPEDIFFIHSNSISNGVNN